MRLGHVGDDDRVYGDGDGGERLQREIKQELLRSRSSRLCFDYTTPPHIWPVECLPTFLVLRVPDMTVGGGQVLTTN